MIFERGEEPTSMEGISEVIKKEIKKKDGERKGLLKRLLERRQKTKRAPAEKVVPVF
jgi:hypothetical protein